MLFPPESVWTIEHDPRYKMQNTSTWNVNASYQSGTNPSAVPVASILLISIKLKEHPRFLGILACNSEDLEEFSYHTVTEMPSVPVSLSPWTKTSHTSIHKIAKGEKKGYCDHANQGNIHWQRAEITRGRSFLQHIKWYIVNEILLCLVIKICTVLVLLIEESFKHLEPYNW